jgi:carboxymethylenebutenolidase
MRQPLLASIVLLLVSSYCFADDKPQIKLPPSGDDDNAAKALNASPRHGEWVDIDLPNSDVKIKTWVVYPERKDKAPVVIVIHEIYGMTDWVRSVTDQLAAEGFIAIAPDLLSGRGPKGGATDSFDKQAIGPAIKDLTLDDVAARLDAVRAYGLALPSATKKTATIGFCWGGGQSFAYAVHQSSLNAAVIYYGQPPKKDMDKIPCPVIGFYGGDDNRITSTVDDTVKQMKDLKKTYTPNIFDGAGHGFLRQQSGRDGANLKAAQRAWPMTIQFLKSNLE